MRASWDRWARCWAAAHHLGLQVGVAQEPADRQPRSELKARRVTDRRRQIEDWHVAEVE